MSFLSCLTKRDYEQHFKLAGQHEQFALWLSKRPDIRALWDSYKSSREKFAKEIIAEAGITLVHEEVFEVGEDGQLLTGALRRQRQLRQHHHQTSTVRAPAHHRGQQVD